MPIAETLYERLAKALPDIPRWVETRAMLLDGTCEVIGLDEKEGIDFVLLRAPKRDLVSVVGWPAREAIVEAVSRCENRAEVLAQFDYQGPVVAALPRWRKTSATIHTLGDRPRLPVVPRGSVRLLNEDEVTSMAGLPPELKRELEAAFSGTRVAATIVDGEAVSFCYSGSVTEQLWDISIETLAERRRRGYAALCVAFMVNHMRKQGKEPVWGALETNHASLGLAEKLGFVPVDRVVVFERPPAV